MKVIVAKHGGFCFGVQRALDIVLTQQASPGRLYTLGPIIHNDQVVAMLKARGVSVLQDAAEAREGDTVVIRSHGVPPDVLDVLRTRGAVVADATCPFVKRIHDKVAEAHAQGRQIFIVGHALHPEVIGINGWCANTAIVLEHAADAQALCSYEKACVVAQTTVAQDVWRQALEALAPHVRDLDVFCSICHTTQARQQEAAQIARDCDCIVVIGGRQSANTAHLYEVCKAACGRCYKIETARELSAACFAGAESIGVIAGASTPEWIIKEVVTNMNELENNTTLQEEEAVAAAPVQEAQETAAQAPEAEQTEAVKEAEAVSQAEADAAAEASSFMEDLEKTLVQIHNGQVMKGVVVHVNENEVCVNIGYKSDGFISKAEFSVDGDVNPMDEVKAGDEIEVEVMKVNDGDGNVLLSKKNVDAKKYWREIIEAYEAGRPIEAVAKEVVKGGLVADASGIRAFIPASQLALRYVEDMNVFVGETMKLKIIELDRSKRRIVASRKAILLEEQEESKKRVWETLEEGQRLQGTVQRLTNFGAFVDIGGVDGLIHITDLSWGRVRHPSDVVKPGDVVDVVVLGLDRERERISLGYKQTQPQPWDSAVERYPVGSIVEGRVVRIVTFGAFVELEPGLDGLVHISNIANHRIEKVEDVLKVGDVVPIMILEVNPENKRISLSIKATQPKEEGEDAAMDDAPAKDRPARSSAPRRQRGDREPTSYSEDSSVTLGDLMPDLKNLITDDEE
nr:bifunctional 4-hydroxy-3-methylbut-2-enyl diphosphate reductase/30S ribosomal protein S1 [Maliibacterium massiliense]